MSTPCCVSDQRPRVCDSTRCGRRGTHRVKHTAQGLQLFLHVLFLSLQLGKCQMGGAAIGGPGGRRSGRDGGRVKIIHS